MKSRVIQDEPDDDRPPRASPASPAPPPVAPGRNPLLARVRAWFRRRP